MASASLVTRPASVERPLTIPWLPVGVAALAMVLTLPGRTHGLGFFTEPMLKSLHLGRESYAFMNLWATLLGALFCFPAGWLLDRLGSRTVFLTITTALGLTVLAMSLWTTGTPALPLRLPLQGGTVTLTILVDLFVFLLLTRGLGQSALSVVSLALIGRAAGQRSGLAMGVYALLVTLGFMGAFIPLGMIVKGHSPDDDPEWWRSTWAGIGWAVLVLGLAGGFLLRPRAQEEGLVGSLGEPGEVSRTLGDALRSPTFWTFSLAISFYGLVVAGTSLFNQSILAERHFDQSVFATITWIGIPCGLAANLVVGALATRWPLDRLMAMLTALFAACLFAFPVLTAETAVTPSPREFQVYLYACVLAVAGGGMTVCFYSVYRRAFGPAHLGTIQGMAQLLTVIFSAVGPQVFASTQTRMGAYAPLFPIFGAIAALLALLTWLAGVPARPIPLPVLLDRFEAPTLERTAEGAIQAPSQVVGTGLPACPDRSGDPSPRQGVDTPRSPTKEGIS
jgi:MFS family permease